MILAAGYGKRMGNLTSNLPKCLLPLGNSTLLDMLLIKLANEGVERIVINLHHQGEKIKKHLEHSPCRNPKILFSEEENILGTGGGIALAERFFENETILVINSDVLTDISVGDFFAFHLQKQSIASMAVFPSQNNKDYSLVLLEDAYNVRGFLGKGQAVPSNLKTGIFTGYQILAPEARAYLHPRFSSVITDFYQPAIQKGQEIGAFLHSGTWIDLGTREQYSEVTEKINSGELRIRDFSGN